MEMPSIHNVLLDEKNNIRYDIVAYRKLADQELVHYVRFAVAHMKKRPKKNSQYQFITIIGRDE